MPIDLISGYVQQIAHTLEEQKLDYSFLDHLNITSFNDYKCYFFLIDSKIIYVVLSGVASHSKLNAFSRNLLKAEIYNDHQKMILIIDATQLNTIPLSYPNKVDLLQFCDKENWRKLFYIYQGLAKETMINAELQKAECFQRNVEKFDNPLSAINSAINYPKE